MTPDIMTPEIDEKDRIIARQAKEIERLKRILEAHHLSYLPEPEPASHLEAAEKELPQEIKAEQGPKEEPVEKTVPEPSGRSSGESSLPGPLPPLGIRSQNPQSPTWNVRPDHLIYEQQRKLFALLLGRIDVHPYRYVNSEGKGQWAPECARLFQPGCFRSFDAPKATKGISCKECPRRQWTKCDKHRLHEHFEGWRYNPKKNKWEPYALGVYPLLPDGTCCFLAFDFDCHHFDSDGHKKGEALANWQTEVDLLRTLCLGLGIDCLVERSRSGNGAHLWIVFSEPVSAADARKFGKALLAKGAQTMNLESFHFYDRMFPMQDILPEGGLGNLIAMPWAGDAMQNENTLFVDEQWNPYPDQYRALITVQKLSNPMIQTYLRQWEQEGLLKADAKEEQGIYPWEAVGRFHPEDAPNGIEMTLDNGICIRKAGLAPRLLNQIRHMAAYEHPAFRENYVQDFGDIQKNRYLYYAADIDGYLRLPRGLQDALTSRFNQAHIEYFLHNCRICGTEEQPIAFSMTFQGQLRDYQEAAFQAMKKHDHGILHAATASGKTVIGLRLAAEYQVPTLIVVDRSALARQWVEAAKRFLDYQPESGRKKKSWVGRLGDGRTRLTGIMDVVMVESAVNQEKKNPFLDQYGLVIIDECHHAASKEFLKLLEQIRPRYLYGLSATPDRSDGLGPTVRMFLGPVRYHISSADQKIRQGMDRWLIPRITRLVLPAARFKSENPDSIVLRYQEVENRLIRDEERNGMIVQDVQLAVKEGRTPVILSKRKDHLKILEELLQGSADHIIVLNGDLKAPQREKMIRRMESLPPDQSLVLLATSQLLGEGFDFPRLDTLMLATPVSWETAVVQSAGRLHREYPGKKDVRIYDYVDRQIPMLYRMYRKRLKHYLHSMAYELFPQDAAGQPPVFPRRVYHSYDYFQDYLNDLRRAKKEIILCSPHISDGPAQEFLGEVPDLQKQGVQVILVTNPEIDDFGDSEHKPQLLEAARQKGVQVIEKDCCLERFCLIDQKLVWFGSIDLLGIPDADQNISRLDNTELIHELMEATFGLPQKKTAPSTTQLTLF